LRDGVHHRRINVAGFRPIRASAQMQFNPQPPVKGVQTKRVAASLVTRHAGGAQIVGEIGNHAGVVNMKQTRRGRIRTGMHPKLWPDFDRITGDLAVAEKDVQCFANARQRISAAPRYQKLPADIADDGCKAFINQSLFGIEEIVDCAGRQS